MPTCQNVNCFDSDRPVYCGRPSVVRVWFPGWIAAGLGPRNFCADHFAPYDPSQRSTERDLQFGAEADAAFAEAEVYARVVGSHSESQYRILFTHLRDRGEHVGGQSIRESAIRPFASSTIVMDGVAWLVTFDNVVSLGDADRAAKRYPLLFQLSHQAV
jgi:hypothetical protein